MSDLVKELHRSEHRYEQLLRAAEKLGAAAVKLGGRAPADDPDVAVLLREAKNTGLVIEGHQAEMREK